VRNFNVEQSISNNRLPKQPISRDLPGKKRKDCVTARKRRAPAILFSERSCIAAKTSKLEVCTIAKMLCDFWATFAEKSGANNELRLPGARRGGRQQRRWWSELPSEIHFVPDGKQAMTIFDAIWTRIHREECPQSIRCLTVRQFAPKLAMLHRKGASFEAMCLAVFDLAEDEKRRWLDFLASEDPRCIVTRP
jgi:hypothetical protein